MSGMVMNYYGAVRESVALTGKYKENSVMLFIRNIFFEKMLFIRNIFIPLQLKAIK